MRQALVPVINDDQVYATKSCYVKALEILKNKVLPSSMGSLISAILVLTLDWVLPTQEPEDNLPWVFGDYHPLTLLIGILAALSAKHLLHRCCCQAGVNMHHLFKQANTNRYDRWRYFGCKIVIPSLLAVVGCFILATMISLFYQDDEEIKGHFIHAVTVCVATLMSLVFTDLADHYWQSYCCQARSTQLYAML